MSRPHDEHGRVVDVDREHGPEWWAMGAEVCECEHRLGVHVELVDGSTSSGTRFACALCPCRDFTLANTMATGDEPSSRQPSV